MKYLSLIILMLSCFNTFSQDVSVSDLLKDSVSIIGKDKIADKIPIASFKKKYIILDFWATWCKPCIDNHKILETLYQENSDSLSVITLSGDKRKDFDKFNEKWISSLTKALDSQQFFFTKYKVSLVPTMFLINTQSSNIRVLNGGLISRKIFQDFTKSKLKKIDEVKQILDPLDVVEEFYKKQPRVSTVKETPFIPTSSSFAFYQIPNKSLYVRRIYVNFSIPGIYKDCLGFTEVRCLYGYNERLDAYSSFELAVSYSDRKNVLPDQLMVKYLKENHANIKFKIVDKLVDSCYFLESTGENVKSESKSKSPSDNTQGGAIKMRKVTLKKLSNTLEEQFRIPVENTLGSAKFYDFDFSYDYGNLESLNIELKKYGLQVELKRYKILKYLKFNKSIVDL